MDLSWRSGRYSRGCWWQEVEHSRAQRSVSQFLWTSASPLYNEHIWLDDFMALFEQWESFEMTIAGPGR